MRSDRTLSLYLFGPLAGLRQRQAHVPILMYHRVPDVDHCATHPYYCTSTAAPVFEQQMRFLRDNGYRSLSISEAYESAQRPGSTRKLVAITFDDGYEDFYTNAFPILTRYNLSATVFLPTAYIGDSPLRFKGLDCLTWAQVRELRRAGMEFGSHTASHPQLWQVGQTRLIEEVSCSKKELEHRLGEAVGTFSYPYAFPEADHKFVDRLQAALEACEYREGVSTVIGRVGPRSNRFFMKRLPVNSHDDPVFFRTKLEGAYDWLHALQYATKRLRWRG